MMNRIMDCLRGISLLAICSALSIKAASAAESESRSETPAHICEAPAYIEDYRIDSASTGELTLAVRNTDFFQNNEYTSKIIKGYTLPGFWIQPSVGYQPIANIKVEAGVHALVYRGAYRYPNFAYSDIAEWKGEQYQKGAHWLPFFRAQVALGNVNIVLGDLYGGLNHRLLRPLYDPELLFTADPEAGLQIIWDTKRTHLDAWIDWRSFIFEDDGHQESFVFGGSFRYDITPREAKLNFYLPVQIVGQHRGGEIDIITERSVQTLMNGAIGAGADWIAGRKALSRLGVKIAALGYYQQSGDIWPFDSGWGVYGEADATLFRDFYLTAGLFHSRKFMSLLGSPFFGNVSNNGSWDTFPRMTTGFLSLEYRRTFFRDFTLGLRGDLYMSNPGGGNGTLSSNSLTAYLRINLDFMLWKKR